MDKAMDESLHTPASPHTPTTPPSPYSDSPSGAPTSFGPSPVTPIRGADTSHPPPSTASKGGALTQVNFLLAIPIGVFVIEFLSTLGFPLSLGLPFLASIPLLLDLHRGDPPSVVHGAIGWVASCLALLFYSGFSAFISSLLLTAPAAVNYFATATEPPPPIHEPYPPPETQSSAVGWVNDAVRALFPLISDDVLAGCVDLLEEALMQNVPSIISSVRLSSVALGSEPVLLTSMRALSNEEWMQALAQSESSDAADPTEATADPATEALRKRDQVIRRIRGQKRKTTAFRATSQGVDTKNDVLPSEIDDSMSNDQGQFINYELSFVYKHTAEARARGLGLHAVANFGTGIKNVGGIEFPVYVDVVEMRGKAMARLLLSAQPPFVRDATVTFTSMPYFEISARPLRSTGFGSINAFNIPLLKGYLHTSIQQVAAAFIRPNTYSLDIDRILLGGESAIRTNALGVFRIHIHRVCGLPKTDAIGLCDPYVTVSFSKFNKPIFSTRTIVKELNPVYDEECFVLVTEQDVTSGENLRLRVCDSDRLGADDVVGMVEVDVAALVDESIRAPKPIGDPATDLFFRRDALAPERPGMKAQGLMEWSLRFYPVWKMSREEVKRAVELETTTGGSYSTPWFLKFLDQYIEKPDWQLEKEKKQKALLSKYAGARYREEVEASRPPTPEMPAGVLQWHIHSADELAVESLDGTWSGSAMSRRKSAALGKPALSDVIDRAPWETADPPSPYVEVALNSKIVYRTRTKQSTPLPSFNAVAERFIRDWQQATISFGVRDYRSLEHAPLLGVVFLRLRDVFKERSQVSQWYPLLGGQGWGRLRISLLFKPVEIALPRGVSAYDVCTVQLTSLSSTNLIIEGRQPTVTFETEYDKQTIWPTDAGDATPSTPADSSFASVASRNATPSKSPTPSHHHELSLSSSRHSIVALKSPTPDSPEELHWAVPKSTRLAVMYRQSCAVVVSLSTRSRRRLKKSKVHATATIRLNDCADNQQLIRTVPVFETSNIREAMHSAQAYAALGTPPQIGTVVGEAKLIGFISVGLILLPGFSRLHRRFTKMDGKIRGAYEIWEATRGLDLVPTHSAGLNDEDSDEEPDMPSESEGSDEDGYATPPDDDDQEAARLARQQLHADDTEAILAERNSHGKALRKANRGIFQYKLARTANFAYDKAKERVLMTRGKTDIVNRARGADLDVERQGEGRL